MQMETHRCTQSDCLMHVLLTRSSSLRLASSHPSLFKHLFSSPVLSSVFFFFFLSPLLLLLPLSLPRSPPLCPPLSSRSRTDQPDSGSGGEEETLPPCSSSLLPLLLSYPSFFTTFSVSFCPLLFPFYLIPRLLSPFFSFPFLYSFLLISPSSPLSSSSPSSSPFSFLLFNTF